MDYGPTIAAAFASPDVKEVRDLRRCIIDIMRNCPQDPMLVQQQRAGSGGGVTGAEAGRYGGAGAYSGGQNGGGGHSGGAGGGYGGYEARGVEDRNQLRISTPTNGVPMVEEEQEPGLMRVDTVG